MHPIIYNSNLNKLHKDNKNSQLNFEYVNSKQIDRFELNGIEDLAII
jgi:hypothetical protein